MINNVANSVKQDLENKINLNNSLSRLLENNDFKLVFGSFINNKDELIKELCILSDDKKVNSINQLISISYLLKYFDNIKMDAENALLALNK